MVMFWILGMLLVLTAVFVVTQTKPVYSVVGLLAHFMVLAAMYVTLNAEFLALIQIMVYVGAIIVLFVFVIALLGSGTKAFQPGPDKMPRAAVPAALLALISLGVVVYALAHPPSNVPVAATRTSAVAGAVGDPNVFGSIADFGKVLFTTHLLPFEMTAFILMVAVIGVVALAGDATPYVPTRQRARIVERDMREAILRGGEETHGG